MSVLEPIIYMFTPFIVLLIFGSGYFYKQWEDRMEQEFKYPKITKEKAISELKELLLNTSAVALEDTHIEADMILLDLIGDDEIRSAFKNIPKGHSLSGV